MTADADLTRLSLLRSIWRLTLTVLVPLLLVSALTYPLMPDRVVIHYSAGQADGYSGPAFAVLALPATLVILAAVASVWIAAGPHLPSSRWKGCWLTVLLLLTVAHSAMILGSL